MASHKATCQCTRLPRLAAGIAPSQCFHLLCCLCYIQMTSLDFQRHSYNGPMHSEAALALLGRCPCNLILNKSKKDGWRSSSASLEVLAFHSLQDIFDSL